MVASDVLALENGDPKLNRPSMSEPLERRPGTKGSWSNADIMRSLLGLAEPTNDMSLSPIESSPYDRLALPLVKGDLFMHMRLLDFLAFFLNLNLIKTCVYLIESVSSIDGLPANGDDDVLPVNRGRGEWIQ